MILVLDIMGNHQTCGIDDGQDPKSPLKSLMKSLAAIVASTTTRRTCDSYRNRLGHEMAEFQAFLNWHALC
jgi:hypothetical protein